MAFIDLLILPLASADSAETAAAEDDLSGEPPGFVGGEKGSNQSDVFRHAGSTKRSQRFDRVCNFPVGVHRTSTFGVDYTRVDGVHADVPRSEFLSKHTGNSVH